MAVKWCNRIDAADAKNSFPGLPAHSRRGKGRQKRSAALVEIDCVFQGMNSGVRKGEGAPRAKSPEERGWPFGTPSARLTLGRLLASRACLCFTRRQGCTVKGASEQDQLISWPTTAMDRSFVVQQIGSASTRKTLNPLSTFLGELQGPRIHLICQSLPSIFQRQKPLTVILNF
jgi:hypothetical protein